MAEVAPAELVAAETPAAIAVPPVAHVIAIAAHAAFRTALPLDRRRQGLVVLDDPGHLPALGPAHHVTDHGRAFQRGFPAALAQARHVQQHIPEVRLVRVVRNDETVALSRIEPLDASGDAHGLFVRISAFQFVTRHPAPLVRRTALKADASTITLFS